MATREKMVLTEAERVLLARALTTQGEFLDGGEVETFASLRRMLERLFGIEVGAVVVAATEQRLARLKKTKVPPGSCRACRGDGRRWDPRKGGYRAEPCPSCGGAGEDGPRRTPATLPSVRVEMGESRHGSPESRLILTWPGRSRDVPHSMMMAVVHAVVARIWAARPTDARWLVNVPAGGEDRQGRAQATITAETISGSVEEAVEAMKVLRVVVGLER